MAKPQYNTQELIDNIKRRCSVPTSQLTYSDEDFVLLANDELQGEIVPMMMSAREEYFVDYVDVNVDSQGSVEFPDDAIGAKLRSVCYVQQTQPLLLINLPRIDLDVVAGVGFGMGLGNGLAFSGFYIQNNTLMIYPNNSIPTGTQLRIYYYKRSLVLAAPSDYGQVVAIDHNTGTIQLSNLPSDWVIGDKLNAVAPQGNFTVVNEEFEITGVSSPSIIVDDTTGIEVGDYITQQGYSAIPQVPIEAHAYLAQLTAVKALEGLGDREGMQAAQAKADKLKTGILTVVSQRVDGSVKKVINASGGLRLGAGFRRGRRGYGF